TLDGRDPVEALLIRLIDTPPFQRLRRLRQLGAASFTFHGAEGSRFTHSLGVMWVARRVFDRLQNHYPELKPHRAVVLVAALFHDLGHGPYSHTGEEMFHYHHEHWTQKILEQDPSIRSLLDGFDSELMPKVLQVYQQVYPLKFVGQWVSGQLDCDRLDYLMRDSYLTGAAYGRLDLDRILAAIDYDPDSGGLVVHRKGLAAIEHYLVVRYFMYAQVYSHRKNVAATWMLCRLIERAKQDPQVLFCDSTMHRWLTQPIEALELPDYLAADDDVVNYHLHRWTEAPDPVIADLCRRFLQRDLFKATEVTRWSEAQQQELLAAIQQAVRQKGWDEHYYCGLHRRSIRGYTLYQKGILMQTDEGLREINELSPLVQSLSHPHTRAWLIYPRDVTEQVMNWVQRHATVPEATNRRSF
ncbi:MAG: HD domain-containing protein, partial [Gloeomargarita sp. SKYG116]|nr:HD domain-containing protein [Gloeomargarita sp. SKYG116]MDW8400437.1 HD domain-containing protein [Gloeomargarita sp. SKYGB_i_bin116]